MRLNRAVLLLPAALFFFPAAAGAAAPDCGASPRSALPEITAKAMAKGTDWPLFGVTSEIFGGNAPGKDLLYTEENHTHLFTVVVRPVKDKRFAADSIVLTDMLDQKGRKERWVFHATLAGRLKAAGFFVDDLDENNATKGTEMVKFGPDEPRASAAFERELAYICGVVAKKTLSTKENDAVILNRPIRHTVPVVLPNGYISFKKETKSFVEPK